MSGRLRIVRAGPLLTVQDDGRPGALGYGVSASGPMDRQSWHAAAAQIAMPGRSGLECTMAGLEFTYEGEGAEAGFAGGAFNLTHNGAAKPWPARLSLAAGDRIAVTPGPAGNYGYIRFSAEIDVPGLLGSRATNTIVGLGGLAGRALAAGDELGLLPPQAVPSEKVDGAAGSGEGPIRIVWGMHADLFSAARRNAFLNAEFVVSSRLDRMGVRLNDPEGVFANAQLLSLISDSVVPGDIQILGDGTPIVLMRDHQPTGGYPRIATVISADLDRFAQLRPGTKLRFGPVSVAHAQALLKGTRS